MMKQTPGKIFVADERGLMETTQFRRYSTFNFGAYFNEHKTPFGSLYALNEETLAGFHSIDFVAEQASYVLVLPITGTVQVAPQPTVPIRIDVEELQVFTLPANSTIRFTNPYETELISFLHLWLTAEPTDYNVSTQHFTFDFQALENRLVEVTPGRGQPKLESTLPFALSLGCFAGRHEAVYTAKEEGARFFVFVLAGAFELEGRLLHEKDGLALWGTTDFELEALSNNALLLVLELRK
jgi:redox-sensitive bicupin YhaK (pirin superfamily)